MTRTVDGKSPFRPIVIVTTNVSIPISILPAWDPKHNNTTSRVQAAQKVQHNTSSGEEGTPLFQIENMCFWIRYMRDGERERECVGVEGEMGAGERREGER